MQSTNEVISGISSRTEISTKPRCSSRPVRNAGVNEMKFRLPTNITSPHKAAKVGPAIDELDGKFERDDVTLYLALSAEHWPNVDPIVAAWQSRS